MHGLMHGSVRRLAIRLLAAASLLCAGGAAAADSAARLQVVASFSVLADMAAQIAGERAEVRALIGADADPHQFRPPPSALRRLGAADLLISNGLGFEPWLSGLLAGLDFAGAHCVASDGVGALPLAAAHDHNHAHDHAPGAAGGDSGDTDGDKREHGLASAPRDPHAWLSPQRALRYVDNIAAALAAADPAHAADFRRRATAYRQRLQAIDAEYRARLAPIPEAARRAMLDHNAFAYLGADYAIEFLAARAAGGEPSARELARLVRLARGAGVSALLAENIADRRLLEQVARDSGLRVGGPLYSGALAASGPASSYLGMLRHNLQLLAAALAR